MTHRTTCNLPRWAAGLARSAVVREGDTLVADLDRLAALLEPGL